MYNEAQSGFAVNRAVKLLAAKSKQSVFYYRFSYKGKYSHYYLPGTNNTVTYGKYVENKLLAVLFIRGMVIHIF